MNLEEYKSQAAQRVPNTAFVEETLQNLKNNRSKLRIPVKKIGKAVGGISLLTAAAFAILVGVGTIRGTLSEVSITDQSPEEEQAILSDREALYMTPLSNPDHTVRLNTEDGKVALNENTTAEEIIACGGVIDSDFGFVGYEQVCNFLRAYRNGETAELVIAELPTAYLPDRRGYQYIGLNEDGTVKGKYYQHDGERLSTYSFERESQGTRYGIEFGYFAASTAIQQAANWLDYHSTVGGMGIDLISFGRGFRAHYQALNFIPVCTISDLLKVSERDGDRLRAEYFSVLSNLGENEGVNILWNGQYSTPAQLELFLKRIEDGSASYCSTTITDLTKMDEYEECFYALEYLDGKFRIFTMKNGFEGEFHTEFFDGYTVEEGLLVFNNGSVEYRFPYVEGELDKLFVDVSPTEKRFIGNDAGVYRAARGLENGYNWYVRYSGCSVDNWHAPIYKNKGGFTLFLPGSGIDADMSFLPLWIDPNDVAKFSADPRNLMKISEEYSEGELLAAEIDGTPHIDGDFGYICAALPDESTGGIKVAGNTELWLPAEKCDIREMPNGKSYLMITEEQWREMSLWANTLDEKNRELTFNAVA